MADCRAPICRLNVTDGGFWCGSWRSWERGATEIRRPPSVTHSHHWLVTRAVCLCVTAVQGQLSSLQFSSARSQRPEPRARRRDESIGRAAKWRACHFNWHTRSSVYPRAARAQMRGHDNKTAPARGNNKLVWSDPGARGQSARVKWRGTNEQSRCLLVFPHAPEMGSVPPLKWITNGSFKFLSGMNLTAKGNIKP